MTMTKYCMLKIWESIAPWPLMATPMMPLILIAKL